MSRSKFHQNVCTHILGRCIGTQSYSNAEPDNRRSADLAERVALKIGDKFAENPKTGNDAKILLRDCALEFLRDAFKQTEFIDDHKPLFTADSALKSMRQFNEYSHLVKLVKKLDKEPRLRAELGGDYLVTPDITIAKTPIIASQCLFASVSCKWTVSSATALSGRSEPLNLVRTRTGKTPYIAVVIFEPLPSRIASIAMGTGDIDCTYHGALYELLEAAKEGNYIDSLDILTTLVNGRRLRDISDLPFDLAA